jgi:ABC-type antimicrobial peptide transport system permease subunit
VFIALTQAHPDGLSFITASQFWAVRVRGDPIAFADTFRRILRNVDPTAATALLTDLQSYVGVTLSPRRFSVALLGAFTAIALVLTTLGLYGVTAYGVEQRRQEIGVRIALGATPAGIMKIVLGRTLRLAGVGVALGLIGAQAAGGFMSRLMFGVSPAEPMLLAGVSAFLFATALLASWVPGIRATRIDTLRALSGD